MRLVWYNKLPFCGGYAPDVKPQKFLELANPLKVYPTMITGRVEPNRLYLFFYKPVRSIRMRFDAS